MPLQARVETTESGQLADREIATPRQNAVKHRTDVSVREKKHVLALAIHTELGGVDLHLVEIQGSDDVGRSQRPAWMSRLAPMHHADDVAAHLRGNSF